jgi:hypothetical protein
LNTGDQITISGSQVGAIGEGATGTVSGTLNIAGDADQKANEVDVEALRAALKDLFTALPQANLPQDSLIKAQTAAGTALSDGIKDGKVNPESLVPKIKEVSESLNDANAVVEQGSKLWESIMKLAPILGPLVAGGAKAVGALFGVPIL